MRRVVELAREKRVTAGAMLQWRYHPEQQRTALVAQRRIIDHVRH
jgi:hypothetical protein